MLYIYIYIYIYIYVYIYIKKQKSFKYMSVLCSYLQCHLIKYSGYIWTEVDLDITKEA